MPWTGLLDNSDQSIGMPTERARKSERERESGREREGGSDLGYKSLTRLGVFVG